MPGASTSRPQPLIWTQPPPPGRQRALGREEIVRAAIQVADEGGAEALTMAAVARRLGPYTPMALYRYVFSKDGLVDLMLDAATAEVVLPPRPSGDWRADLWAQATSTWNMVKRHGWYAQLFHTRPPAGPHMLRHTEFALAVLTGEGVQIGEAMLFAALIDRHVFGSGLQEAEERRMRTRYGLDSVEKFLAAMAPVRELAAADGGNPNLAGWLAQPAISTPDEQFELGLACLLDGIELRLKGDARVGPTGPGGPARSGRRRPGRGR
ncbi:MAG: TetR/AcrR family transcriptional regulator C-terminal domain-containing protein [Candidatus Dormibacteraeota bacterium]|nr:TetR/AcrR family transcriptional regulator C-terminal domain-containing protein [Candidatus Dormibacteraeota bacterium]